MPGTWGHRVFGLGDGVWGSGHGRRDMVSGMDETQRPGYGTYGAWRLTCHLLGVV